MRNAFRSLSIAFSVLAVLSCSETIQSTSPIARRAMLSLAPQFDAAARQTAAQLEQVGVDFDHVRIIIIRPAADTLKDTTLAFAPADNSLTLELAVLATAADTLTATVQYVSGTSVLFQGTAPVVAVPFSTTATAGNTVSIAVKYTGPGATVAKLVVTPGTGTYTSSNSTQFTATALDASNVAVANPPVVWSVDDTAAASIATATGLLTPKRSRAQVTVIVAIGAIADSVQVTLVPPSAGLRVIQGAAQAGLPGSQLPIPVIVQAVASDGLPGLASGLSASFAANGAGSVSPASAPFDANSRAQALVTLGASAGGVFLYSATAGGFSVQFPEIAVVGPPTQLIPNGSTTVTMTAGVAPTPIPGFRIADALGNSVPNVPIKATITLANPLTTTTTPPFVVDTIGVGDLTLIASQLTVAGSYTIVISSANAAVVFPSLTYTVTVNPAAAAKLAFVAGPTNVTANAVMSPAVTVAILDSFGNLATSSTAFVTISVDPATGTGVTPGGTLTVAAVNGVATFSNLTFSPTRTGVKLKAASGSLVAILSAAFNIQ